MKLVVASNNQGKIREIKEIFSGYFEPIQSLREAGIELEAEENGTSFEENALIKARAAREYISAAVLSDDSGLCVECLNGAPGIHSARYAGEPCDDERNIQKLLECCRRYPGPWPAHFHSAVVLIYPDGREVVAHGDAFGQIIEQRRGEDGFGYDPVFYYPPLNKTFGEMTPGEKNAVSHRRKALDALYQKIKTES